MSHNRKRVEQSMRHEATGQKQEPSPAKNKRGQSSQRNEFDDNDKQSKIEMQQQNGQFAEIQNKIKAHDKLIQQKREKNPFVKTLQKASRVKQSQDLLNEINPKSGQAGGKAQSGEDDQFLQAFQVNPADALLKSDLKLIPKTPEQYLENMTEEIDTNELLEIVQVFQHKQNRQGGYGGGTSSFHDDQAENGNRAQLNPKGTNDYVVVVLQINSTELQQFYGNGRYLVQIWKNKQRLFQHVHDYEIKSIYLNKTELAYTIKMPSKNDSGRSSSTNAEVQADKKPFDNHLNFIYVIQPFTQKFARIKYPFDEDHSQFVSKKGRSGRGQSQARQSDTVLFINDEYLVVAENKHLKYAKTEDFLKKISRRKESQGGDYLGGSSFADGHAAGAYGNAKGGQHNRRIKYFQELVPTDSSDMYAINSSQPKKKDQWKQFQGIAAGFPQQLMGHSNGLSPSGSLNKIYTFKRKDHKGSKSLYDYVDAYEESGCIETISFKSCMLGIHDNILAVEQSFNNKSSQSETNNCILVYAAKSDNLVLSIHKLCVENQNIANQQSLHEDEEADDTFAFDNTFQIQDQTQNFANKGQDFQTVVQERGSQARGDHYVSLKILNISENQIMTILQTKDGHVDIQNDLLLDEQDPLKVSDRLTDRLFKDQKMKGKISDIAFGSEKLHVQIASPHADGPAHQSNKANQNSEELKSETYQFNINFQTSKVQYQSKRQLPSLVTSILDEEFFKLHIQIYDDMKLMSGLLVLAHGQCLSMYHTSQHQGGRHKGPTWYHYFNRQDAQRSNRKTKAIAQLNHQNMSDGEDSQDELSKEQVICRNGFSEHCYFQNKYYEIDQVEFFPIKSHNIFEILLSLTGGQIRRVSIIYPNQKATSTLNDDIDHGHHANQIRQPKSANDKIMDLKAQSQLPIIVSRNLLSKCGNISKYKEYVTQNLFSQINYSMYRQLGIFEKKMFLLAQDYNQFEQLSPEIFTNGEDNLMTKVAQIDEQSAEYYVMVPVQNAKKSHAFFYDKRDRLLNVYNIDRLDGGEEQAINNINQLNQERLMVQIPQFDFSPKTKYFLDEELLLYVWNGNLIEINLITGAKEKIDFEGSILTGQYFILPGKQIYYKTKQNNLFFADLNWVPQGKDNGHHNQKQFASIKSVSKTIKYRKIMNNQSSLYRNIEYDVINNELVTFSSTNIISVFPNLTQYERDLHDSFQFEKRFLASNLNSLLMNSQKHALGHDLDSIQKANVCSYLCPSEYTSNLCALDAVQNLIYVWNTGSGKLTKKFQELIYNFSGYKKHNDWKGSTLVYKDKSQIVNEALNNLNDLVFERQRDISKSRYIQSKYCNDVQSQLASKYESIQVQEKDVWRKIRVEESGVVLEKEFYHDYKPGSKIFVSSTNDVVLEFYQDHIDIFQIRNDNNTQFVYQIKRMCGVEVPNYFSSDFKRFIGFEIRQKQSNENQNRKQYENLKNEDDFVLKIHETTQIVDPLDKTCNLGKYNPVEGRFLPEYESIQKNNQDQPFIYFSSKDSLCYLNINNIEQTIKISSKEELLSNKKVIQEKFLSPDKMSIKKELLDPNFHEKQLASMPQERRHEIKSSGVQDFYVNLKQIYNIQNQVADKNNEQRKVMSMERAIMIAKDQNLVKQDETFSKTQFTLCNLRCMQAFSYNSWMMIDMLVQNQISIDDIDPEKLPELMRVILPDGQNLTSLLVKNCNLTQLEKLTNAVSKSREGHCSFPKIISFEIIPDIQGLTPLHECVNNTYTKAAEDILRLLGKNNLCNHIQIIDDILSELIEQCPIAMSKYFFERMIKCPWAMKQTKGNLKTADKDVDFGVFSNTLCFLDQDEIEDQIFEKETLNNHQRKAAGDDKLRQLDEKQMRERNNQEQKRLPMSIKVFDIPKFHHFSSQNGRLLVQAFSQSDDISIFDRKFVQAILEYQWPAVRLAILRDLFAPYIAFLVAFNYYAIVQFEAETSDPKSMFNFVNGIIVKCVLVVLSGYFLKMEYAQLKNEGAYRYFTDFWNYTDIIPVFLVMSAISFSTFSTFRSKQAEMEYEREFVEGERYMNALASFFIWSKFLYFFRVFRQFGHLIKTIMEVLIDMQVFVVILGISMLAFSGTFFILAQNNKPQGVIKEGDDDKVFVDSYAASIQMTFQLMLGDFSTDQFGEVGSSLVYLVFVIAALFLIVVMLNLLIAIISETFANVQSQAQRKMYQEFAQLICESLHLLTEKQMKEHDSQGNYLFICQIDHGGNQATSIDSGGAATQEVGESISTTSINGINADSLLNNGAAHSNGTSGMNQAQLQHVQDMIQTQIFDLKESFDRKLNDIKSQRGIVAGDMSQISENFQQLLRD